MPIKTINKPKPEAIVFVYNKIRQIKEAKIIYIAGITG